MWVTRSSSPGCSAARPSRRRIDFHRTNLFAVAAAYRRLYRVCETSMQVRLLSSLVFLIALLAMSASTARSQPKSQPDFSGTWLLDQKKSNDSGLTTRPDLPIKINHQEPEFRITRSSERNGQIVE